MMEYKYIVMGYKYIPRLENIYGQITKKQSHGQFNAEPRYIPPPSLHKQLLGSDSTIGSQVSLKATKHRNQDLDLNYAMLHLSHTSSLSNSDSLTLVHGCALI
ncbi:hypothetical protein KIL84_019830 [Mauremys mutica]|uniref:Uncharacterized protein n=1 Tax=Mauremys mutica TaxID=74926 RepID=A0A9D4BAM9_9SAUR|nr:hypothetical protein KIL84_019830 [Mauremys mutica]